MLLPILYCFLEKCLLKTWFRGNRGKGWKPCIPESDVWFCQNLITSDKSLSLSIWNHGIRLVLFPQITISTISFGLLWKDQILSELIWCGICTLEESVSDTLQSMWKTEYIQVKFLSKSLSVRVLKARFYPDDMTLLLLIL